MLCACVSANYLLFSIVCSVAPSVVDHKYTTLKYIKNTSFASLLFKSSSATCATSKSGNISRNCLYISSSWVDNFKNLASTDVIIYKNYTHERIRNKLQYFKS